MRYKNFPLRFPNDDNGESSEHQALTVLAQALGCSMNTAARAAVVRFCESFGRDLDEAVGYVRGFKAGTPRADR